MKEKIVSNEATITAEMGRFIQITCKDLPKKHHNHFVNLPKYCNCKIGDTGRVVYVRGYNYGLLQFIKEEK